MELQGLLKSWNDDKGFGFIQPHQDGAEVFVHISAIHGDRRPVAGDAVVYSASQDQQGRLRAEHMRVAGASSLDRPPIRQKSRLAKVPAAAEPKPSTARQLGAYAGPVQNLGPKLLVLAALCGLPLLGSLQLLLNSGFIWGLVAYALTSVLSFCQYWGDKRNALKGRRRTPEKAMHLLELLGGWPGALLAQQCFRHKTRKLSYQLAFWAIVAAHQLFWVDRLVLGGRYFANGLRYLP
ncbi:DUF1294 domain-containing protein [Pseudomonas sp.]|uniref:DUF1294 domain-containing protein n=1 Tax=Pseudomonas sp. TaxID=306 RepID=UPI0027352860|nr:DUF1294 domain-containing protein [Pseudomonas sp.]MDP3813709.1 DUF1294 domain-containing protein [Pseudomonas sp.]